MPKLQSKKGIKGQWGAVALAWLPRAHGNALKVMTVLSSLADKESSTAWPSIDTLQGHTGLSKSSVYVALSELERLGFIERYIEDSTTMYEVNFNPRFPETGKADSRKPGKQIPGNQEAPTLYIRSNEKIIDNADKPRANKDAGPSSPAGEEKIFVKISGKRRVKAGREEQDAPRQGKPRQDWMRAQSLAQHLAMHTRRDYRNYLGSGQNAAWMRLLAMHPYETVRDAIDEAVSPTHKPKLERGDYVLNAHAIEFYMKNLQKRPEDMSDEERELAKLAEKMWEGV